MKSKTSGLDIDLGNRCSANAYGWAKKTFSNRLSKPGEILMDEDGAFSNLLKFGGNRIGISSDGIGTKIELAERTGIYKTLGFDLMAMVTDDLAANGLEATNISNILDVDQLDYEIIDSLMEGLNEAASVANVSISGGEIAELGSRIGGFGDKMHFNWGATAIGMLPIELENAIDGKKIKTGDIVISLKSNGLRSNGFSLVRQIMQDNFGDNWHKEKYNSFHTWGQMLIKPSRIYCSLIAELISIKAEIHGMAHITGGGIIDNLSRILKVESKGAKLDHLFEPQDFVLKLQKLGKVEEERTYRLWNMGNAFLMIVAETDVDRIMKYIIQNGWMARIAGKIIDQPLIQLKTEGNYKQLISGEVI